MPDFHIETLLIIKAFNHFRTVRHPTEVTENKLHLPTFTPTYPCAPRVLSQSETLQHCSGLLNNMGHIKLDTIFYSVKI